MTSPFLLHPCPCGSGVGYDTCCGPLHRGEPAVTAEQLMRSRYCAFALGDAGHVFRTWHPSTRPADVDLDPSITWTGLTVLAAGEDWVEFEARYEHASTTGRMHERSRFERRAGRWFYVDGVVS